MIADIRLLRALFKGEDESVVYASGQGGLFQPWNGELEETPFHQLHARKASEGPERGRKLFREDDDQLTFDDVDDWEKVLLEAEDEDDNTELQGRKLFKCLQLDLSSFGLEKAGLAHQFAGLLTSERINLLYSSTFKYVPPKIYPLDSSE